MKERTVLSSWIIGAFTIMGLLGCSGLFRPPPKEGTERYFSLLIGKDVLVARPLDDAQKEGLPHWEVYWSDGKITGFASISASGKKFSSAMVKRTPAEISLSYWGVHQEPVREVTISVMGDYRQVTRSGDTTVGGCAFVRRTFDAGWKPLTETCVNGAGQILAGTDGCEEVRTIWSGDLDALESSCFNRGVASPDTDGVHRTTRTYDSHGWELERTFWGVDGKPVARSSDGCFRWQSKWSLQGDGLEGRCLNSAGLPSTLKNTDYAGLVFSVDENHCRKTMRYLGMDEKPAEEHGIAEVQYDNTPLCEQLEVRYLDAQAVLKKPRDMQSARISYTYDGEGQITRKQCWGDKGVEVACMFADSAKEGGTVLVYAYDGRGRRISSRAYTAAQKPTTHDNSYPHEIRLVWNEAGRVLKETFWDADGKPAIGLGVYGLIYSYNELGRQTSKKFLDKEERPMASSVGCAEIREVINERNQMMARECRDKDGALTGTKGMISSGVEWPKGTASVTLERDGEGTVEANIFMKPDGREIQRILCTIQETPCYRD